MMQPTPNELETLLAHEARYFELWSQVTRGEHAWFLDSPDMPDYHSANRALRLRGSNANPQEREVEATVAEIIGHYRGRNLPVVVDVDPVAESLGFGRALRRRGVTPVIGDTLLMRFAGTAPPVPPVKPVEILKSAEASCVVSVVSRPSPSNSGNNEANFGVNTKQDPTQKPVTKADSTKQVALKENMTADMQAWVDLAGSDEDNEADAAFWRRVAMREALSPDCRLYLARGEEQPVAACQLFSHAGWGLIDSVITHPNFRRRGFASQVIAQAVADSMRLGNALTYLYTERGSAGEQVYQRLGFEGWGINTLHRHILY